MNIQRIIRDFQESNGAKIGRAIVESNPEAVDKLVSELSAMRDLFEIVVCVDASQFSDAPSFHLALLESLWRQVQEQNIPLLPKVISRLQADDRTVMQKFAYLMNSLVNRNKIRILLCLKNFQYVSNFYTPADSPDYMQFRECKCSILLTANQTLVEIECASIGYRGNSTLTGTVTQVTD